MDYWLSVHSKAYSKVYLIFDLLFVLNLGGLIIFSIYYCKSKYSLEYLIEDDPDIDLTGLKSFSFSRISDVEYDLGISNLGTTGKLYLNCYTGKCYYEKEYECTETRCTGSGEDRECETYDTTCYTGYSKEEHSCSNECRRSRSSYCGEEYCPRGDYDYDYSTCKHDDDSKSIKYPKSCNAENLILYWGHLSGIKLYYKRVNNTEYKTLSYLNSAVTANESCPIGKKMCGILDNLGNKLCYPQYLNCPLNYITTNKRDNNYSSYDSAELKNKTVYFTNEATENGKVIGGLFVDSDLLIKYNDEDCEKLEEGTVSDLLDSHPYKLYRNSLSYDPYTNRSSAVQKGKSYLKWCIPGVGKEKNISKIKELKVVFDFNVTTNKNVINPTKSFSTSSYFVCLPGYIGLFFALIIFLFAFYKQNDTDNHFGRIYSSLDCINCIILVIFVVSSILVLVGTILACVNIGHISIGNKLDLATNIFGILKGFDITIICMNFALIILLIILCLYLYITPKYLPDKERITQYKTHKDNSKAMIGCDDFKNNNIDEYYKSSDFKNNSNKDDYYNSSDFKINNDNNKDPYYNSSDFNNNNNDYYNNSDFNNNLLNNQPEQANGGL